jgi:hypothetical protein
VVGDCSGREPARARAARMMADTSDCSDSRYSESGR